jgi:hypothetical protein
LPKLITPVIVGFGFHHVTAVTGGMELLYFEVLLGNNKVSKILGKLYDNNCLFSYQDGILGFRTKNGMFILEGKAFKFAFPG